MREFRINLLGDRPVRIDKIVGLLEIKSWIAAKKFRELVKAPLKTGGLNGLVPFRREFVSLQKDRCREFVAALDSWSFASERERHRPRRRSVAR